MVFFISFIFSSRLFSIWFLFSASILRSISDNLLSVRYQDNSLSVSWYSKLNSSSSILPFRNALDTTLSNTANADVAMSFSFMTFESFLWYVLVSAAVTPLTLAPARDVAPNGMLTGRPMHVLNIATLDIPVATLNPLEQAFSHTNRSNILVYFFYFLLYRSSNFNNPCFLD